MNPVQVLYDEVASRCGDVALIDGTGRSEHRVGVMACDETVGLVLAVEVGIGADGRPAASLRAIGPDCEPVTLSVLEVDGQVMVST